MIRSARAARQTRGQARRKPNCRNPQRREAGVPPGLCAASTAARFEHRRNRRPGTTVLAMRPSPPHRRRAVSLVWLALALALCVPAPALGNGGDDKDARVRIRRCASTPEHRHGASPLAEGSRGRCGRRSPARLLARLRGLAALAREARRRGGSPARLRPRCVPVGADAGRGGARSVGRDRARAPRLPAPQRPDRPVPPVAVAAVRGEFGLGSSPPSAAGSRRFPIEFAASADMQPSSGCLRS